MKLITAIIRENQLDKVREALIEAEVSRITVSRVSGHGNQIREEIFRGKKVIPSLIPKMKIEIAVNDEFVEKTVITITESAKTSDSGEIGDGKIFILPLEECVRIRTGEKGKEAI
jgi:nitrogen regulatory protein P-II 1